LNKTADPSIKHHTIPTTDYPKLLVDALPLSFITTVPTLYASKANAHTPYKTSVTQKLGDQANKKIARDPTKKFPIKIFFLPNLSYNIPFMRPHDKLTK